LAYNVKLSNSAIISYVCQQNHLSQEQRTAPENLKEPENPYVRKDIYPIVNE
jgi:hypothetical protein